MEKTMEKIVALAKARGFVYPGSEIYGGLANTWDYGNLGVELKNNVKRAWWQKFIQESPYNVGVDCAIPVSYTHLDVYKRQGICDCVESEQQYHGTGIQCMGRSWCSIWSDCGKDVYKRQVLADTSRNSSSLSEQSRVFRL